MTAAVLDRVKTSPVDIETKYGEHLSGFIEVHYGLRTATLTTTKGKGWRTGHRRWMGRARPGATKTTEYQAHDYTTGITTVTTRWSLT